MNKFIFVTGNKAYSSWSMRPWLALKHTGATFEEIVVPLYVPGYKEKLLKHSPAGKVPILKLDGQIVWDSLAICEYLAESSPQAELWPQNSAMRAEARAVSAEMHSSFSDPRANAVQLPGNRQARRQLARVADRDRTRAVHVERLP